MSVPADGLTVEDLEQLSDEDAAAILDMVSAEQPLVHYTSSSSDSEE